MAQSLWAGRRRLRLIWAWPHLQLIQREARFHFFGVLCCSMHATGVVKFNRLMQCSQRGPATTSHHEPPATCQWQHLPQYEDGRELKWKTWFNILPDCHLESSSTVTPVLVRQVTWWPATTSYHQSPPVTSYQAPVTSHQPPEPACHRQCCTEGMNVGSMAHKFLPDCHS